MQSIEQKYPELVNCLGNIENGNAKCNACKFIYPCILMYRELKRNPYKRGKYRTGFGRSMISKKSVWWTGDDI